MHIYFLIVRLGGPRNSKTPIAMSTVSTQILVSNTFIPSKRNQGSLEKMAKSRTKREKTQDKTVAFCSARKKKKTF